MAAFAPGRIPLPPGLEDEKQGAIKPASKAAARSQHKAKEDPWDAGDPWSKKGESGSYAGSDAWDAGDPWSKSAGGDGYIKSNTRSLNGSRMLNSAMQQIREQPAPSPAPGKSNGSTNSVEAQEPTGTEDNRLEGEATAKIVVQLEDGSTDATPMTCWDDFKLSKEIMDGIFEMGFTKPSKIQGLALPIAMKGRNIIGQARNGSGKTAAFALAMLANVDVNKRAPQGLCVCPTRELTMQNHAVIQRLGKFTGLEFFLAVPQEQRAPRSVSAQVVVGTPGKLQDWMKKRIIDPNGFRIFVVDEADQMIDEEQSMGGQVLDIHRMLSKDQRKELQILFFSATWPDYVAKLAKSMVPRPNIIHVKKEDLTLTTITQTFMNVGTDDNKRNKLSELYSVMNVGQSIIFVNTRQTAFDLATFMKSSGHAVSLITGTQRGYLEVAERDKVMQEFRDLVTRVLISTDVLSRGIDVPSVTVVVNYDLPNGSEKMETYLHRIGRTGRFGKKGLAVNLASDRDRHRIDEIKRFYNCDMLELSGDVEEVEAMLKPILG